MTIESNDTVVQVKNLKMYFTITRGLFRRKAGEIKAVDDVSFAIKMRHWGWWEKVAVARLPPAAVF